MSSISASDSILIESLRNAVKDDLTPYYDTDFNLLRWLQGHNRDIAAVAPKLRCHMRFRKSCWDLDGMVNQPRNHHVQQHWQYGITGQSGKIDNVVVNIEQTGRNDYWGMLQTYPLLECMKSRIYDLEWMLQLVMQLEKNTGKQASVLYVMDLECLKFDKHLLQLLTGPLKGLSQFMAEHYVELIRHFIIINAPSFVVQLWRIVRPLLPERTKHKVRILGDNWRQEILNYAVCEELPERWNLPGSDPIFGANLPFPVTFDVQKYYHSPIPDDCLVLMIPAGNIDFITVVVDKEDTILKWFFHGDGELSFGLFRTDDEDEIDTDRMEMVYPYFERHAGPTIVPLEDSVLCVKKGVYKMLFGNEHAWWHTLKISYKLHTQ